MMNNSRSIAQGMRDVMAMSILAYAGVLLVKERHSGQSALRKGGILMQGKGLPIFKRPEEVATALSRF
jgi:hypothetical protein